MTAQETAALTITPTQFEGPYYKVGSPHRSSLIEPGITGTPMVLTGRVLNEHGTPIPGAAVDIWQSDDVGNYDMVGDHLRGHVFADANGVYSIETIVPRATSPARPGTSMSRSRG